jgi:uncharacterized protein
MTGRIGFYPAELVHLQPDRWTKPFWESGHHGQLVACRCTNCGTFRMPPTPFCARCQSQDVDWVKHSGLGSVFTYTVVHRTSVEALRPFLPYAISAVDLAEAPGCRLVCNFDVPMPRQLTIGMAVRVCWDRISAEVSIPVVTAVQSDS